MYPYLFILLYEKKKTSLLLWRIDPVFFGHSCESGAVFVVLMQSGLYTSRLQLQLWIATLLMLQRYHSM